MTYRASSKHRMNAPDRQTDKQTDRQTSGRVSLSVCLRLRWEFDTNASYPGFQHDGVQSSQESEAYLQLRALKFVITWSIYNELLCDDFNIRWHFCRLHT